METGIFIVLYSSALGVREILNGATGFSNARQVFEMQSFTWVSNDKERYCLLISNLFSIQDKVFVVSVLYKEKGKP